MEAEVPTTKTVDQSTLARLKNTEGTWQKGVVEALSAGTWARWFKNRLEGEDPYFSYRRGEYPQETSNLFFNLFRTLPNLDTEPASEGLGIYLRYLHWQHCSEDLAPPPSIEVLQALNLLLAVRPRDTRARPVLRRVLRDFISSGLLRNRTEEDRPYTVSSADLHREALVALSVLQRRGDTADWDVWNVHRTEDAFDQWYEARFDPRFALTAFSGIALSAPTPSVLPDGMVVGLFRLVNNSDQTLRPRHSLEALFVDRPDQRQQVIAYLWDEIDQLPNPEEMWDRLRGLLDRFPGSVPPYNRMEILRPQIDFPEHDTLDDPFESSSTGTWDRGYDAIREREPAHI
jgi:hypothetical protein